MFSAHGIVYTILMKNVTLSADENLIERARMIARSRETTLNDEFRAWLANYTEAGHGVEGFDALMQRLNYVNAGRHFTRDEMNER